MSHQKIFATLACNLDSALLNAALPLFANAEVEAIEWSFDTLYAQRDIPDWFVELLKAFSANHRLIGHGVFFSLFSGRWTMEQQKWLDELERKCEHFDFDHITEHFGFMTGKNFHEGAPMSLPYNTTTLAIGRDRLQRIYQACKRPVGLENLAFAYSLAEVQRHGAFLAALLQPINGFIILDLHNLYCQLHNFNCNFDNIIQLYPLERVREIHISGGSWENSVLDNNQQIRRDTHDGGVPVAVFDLLKLTIPLCPNLKFVVLEQLGTGLQTETSHQRFRADFLRMKAIIKMVGKGIEQPPTNIFSPTPPIKLNTPLTSETLHQQQRVLAEILETATDYQTAIRRLNDSILAHSDWQIEQWQPQMIATAIAIAQKWKVA